MSLEKIADCLKKHKRFLITSHVNLEGDALGSELALAGLLKCLGKYVAIINADSAPNEYNFMPGLGSITKYSTKLKERDFDCFVALDCSDISRCGPVAKLIKKKMNVLNIDHHISSTAFGDINLVDIHVSSCAEIIYKIFKKMHVPFNRDIALCLYVGILTDTGSFRYSNTSPATHLAVADLLNFGVDPATVYRNIYENKPFADMKFLISLFSKVKRSFRGRVAWAELKSDVMARNNFSFDLSERILSFERALKDVEIALLFREEKGKIPAVKVNLRSHKRIDVNKIAAFFGGGGHKTASGCTIYGTLAQAKRKVFKKIKEVI